MKSARLSSLEREEVAFDSFFQTLKKCLYPNLRFVPSSNSCDRKAKAAWNALKLACGQKENQRNIQDSAFLVAEVLQQMVDDASEKTL